jgi:type II secretory pathway pseudopilin PulG
MKPMNKYKQCGRMSAPAFTLVEVVIAAALLIMALALFMETFVSAKRSAVMADNRLKAVQNARTVMETALSHLYLDNALSNGLHWTNSVMMPGVTSCYYVAPVTQGIIVVKNVYVTNSWTNPGTRTTSTVSLAGSIGYELHY